MSRTIAVVGLGLIGGSLAMALRGFEDYSVLGVDVDQATLDFACTHAVADRVTDDGAAAVAKADVVFLCMHPQGILDFLSAHRDDFKPGALVSDVCGVKTAIMEGAKVLPPEVDFIGCHPMAGKETSRVWNAERTMFQGAHFILTPREESRPEHMELMERMARHLGCRDVVRTTPEAHDALIAYTSQVMHVLAVAVCDDPDLFLCKGFEGGSFRDCTRVAALDVPLWKELMTLNADALTQVIIRLEENIHAYRVALEHHDVERVTAKLEYSSNRKRRMNLPGPGQVSLDLDLFQ